MNETKNKEQDRRLNKVETHIETTNRELGQVQTDLAKVKTDVANLKKMTWFVMTIIIGSFLLQLISTFF